MAERFYITTPIYYVNDAPHIGHAYTSVAADTAARWNRLKGRHVRFLTGTDEHGLKVAQAARAAGITPRALADANAERFKALRDTLGLSYDRFIRTTDDDHTAFVQRLFARLEAAGDVYEGTYRGHYHTADERFLTDEEYAAVRGTPDERFVVFTEETNLFFRLSRYADALLAHYEADPHAVRPAVRLEEVKGYLRKGLKDLSISRTSFDWGVPLPGRPGHVAYVWLDALANYVSGATADDGTDFWPADVHVIGKDILIFHTVYWPAFLLSAGLPLPKRVFAHGWWTSEGAKISKRTGNTVDPRTMVERWGADAFRYFLLRENPFGEDGDFSELALIARVNGELVNDVSNLVQRTCAMVKKYRAGAVPPRTVRDTLLREGDAAPHASAIAPDALLQSERYAAHMDALAFREALDAVLDLVRAGNLLIDRARPWDAARDPAGAPKLDAVLYDLLETCRVTATMLLPFMPERAALMLRKLGLAAEPPAFDAAAWGLLEPGAPIGPDDYVFARIHENDIRAAKERREATLARVRAAEAAPQATAGDARAPQADAAAPATITYDDFAKVELRAAKVLAAGKVPKADKLLQLTLDAGEGAPRTVLSGIAQVYGDGAALVGRTIVLVANLAPRTMRGIASHGMILAADGADGRPAVVFLDDAIPAGAVVK